jgi:hypothetical protein
MLDHVGRSNETPMPYLDGEASASHSWAPAQRVNAEQQYGPCASPLIESRCFACRGQGACGFGGNTLAAPKISVALFDDRSR